MFDGCSSFNVEQPFQPALMNSSSADWLHTPPSQMPWSLPDASQPSVMRFTGDSLNTTDLAMKALNPDLQTLSKSQSKRKSWDCDIEYNVPPAKQLITEEKMAENLNCLHISNSYVSHQIGSSQPMSIPLPESSPSLTESASSSSDSPSLLDTTLDGKDRTVSLCEQLRKLISESSVLPSPLLNKVERPTTALVLWQPPGESIFKHVKATAEKDSNHLQEQNTEPKASTSGINISTQSSNHSNWDDLMDNNNSVSAMDLNLFPSSGLSTLQPLPSEVPLPDDDFMDMPEDSMMDF
ncbi:uncharacterized protein LOC113212139 [Frankliniella occidentalis]|uniref:Uncharacterized protein LOC113212139 n=1 Tax=Frankliniella occidentalis TaxID=133901 RepID=A0A6J1SZZ3_FRAOC|nr:uncharacterized protein LOC113212139 [Frankliniella occidentalis]XP_026286519.1 uncharacterized protein LOC113212139 [Frankliniella occidentalis]XP_026286521.1 uncharacterized protein LOC113212139 [Frankliniella occidentalis]